MYRPVDRPRIGQDCIAVFLLFRPSLHTHHARSIQLFVHITLAFYKSAFLRVSSARPSNNERCFFFFFSTKLSRQFEKEKGEKPQREMIGRFFEDKSLPIKKDNVSGRLSSTLIIGNGFLLSVRTDGQTADDRTARLNGERSECWMLNRWTCTFPLPLPILEGKTASSWDTARITRGCCVSTMIIVDYGLGRKLNTHRAARSCTFRRWNAWSDGTISLGPSYSINDRATRVHVIPCGFTFGNVAHCVWRTRCTSCLLALRGSLLSFRRQLEKKKKKTSASIPFLDFPILFFFSPLFWGGKIWRFEKNLHTKILRDCNCNRDLTVDRLNGLLILVLKHESITEGSSGAISVFLCLFAWILLVTIFILSEYIFEDKAIRGERLKI